MSTDPSLKENQRPSKCVPVGKYEVVAHIATGGMGDVYRARDSEIGREVALKVINRKMAKRPDAMERFHVEARNAAQLRHENIVTVYEVGEFKNLTYLAMEFVDGVDLADHIDKNGPLDVEEARQITFQAARALHHAFKRGIVHRDIKPSNFLLTRKGGKLTVKMTDFGLSRQVDDDEQFRVTREGFTVGTVDYIAPEQARDSRAADVRSDIYSLGCTLYHMLTGQPPFNEGSLAERILKHLEAEPVDVREHREEIPAELARVVRRMLAKNPDDRYQTPRELLQALSQAEVKLADTAPITRPPEFNKPAEKRGPRLKAPESETEAKPEKAGPRLKASRESAPEPKKPKPRAPKTQADPTKQGLLLGIGAGVLLFAIVLLLILRPWKSDTTDEDQDGEPNPDSVERPPIGKDRPPDPIDKTKDRPKDQQERPPPDKTWPPLRADAAAIDREKLTGIFSQNWDEKPLPADLPVFRVCRHATAAGQYSSLTEALRAVQEKGGIGGLGGHRVYDAIVEVEDNGPLFETASTLTGKSVLIRAAVGYRPLVCWDVERERARPLPPLLSSQGGRLALEGLEFVLSADSPVSDARTAFVRAAGDFSARDCIFSVAGTHPAGVAVVRLEGDGKVQAARCRLSRCLGRGSSVVGLDIASGSHEVLVDDSLLVTGDRPVIEFTARSGDRDRLLLLRSTLVSHSAAIKLSADEPAGLASDLIEIVGWDTIVARCGQGREGAMLELPPRTKSETLRWRATNCLYAGWKNLLRGPLEIGDDIGAWERHWAGFATERIEPAGWPVMVFPEPADVAISACTTDRAPGSPVGFASTSWPCLAGRDRKAPLTLGCPVTALPVPRERWPQWTTRRFVTPAVELTTSALPPDIPSATSGKYTGERIDLAAVDLGVYLDGVQRNRKLASRLVLHLHRTGQGKLKPSSAVRLKDVDVILFLEPTKKGAGKEQTSERLVLQSGGTLEQMPGGFIEVDNGNLEIIGGEIRAGDCSHLVKVRGGSLRMHDVRLTGPLPNPPEVFEALVQLQAGAARKPEGQEQAPSIGIHECVLVSGRSGIVVKGGPARVRIARSVVVAGQDAVVLEPPSTGSPRLSCSLESSTLAAARAAVRVGRTAGQDVPDDPVVISSRSCAFLSPFGGKAGLLLFDPQTLQRGALLWQGEQDLFDKRLHFGGATPTAIPEQPAGLSGWAWLWGSSGARKSTRDFAHAHRFEADRWPLERLALNAAGSTEELTGFGADLQKLGLVRKRPR